jgi:hypothetical protein
MILPRFLASALSVAALARAEWSSVSTSWSFSSQCTTFSDSTGVSPVPTSYERTTTTSISSAPLATALTTVYVTANTTIATPVTTWQYTTLFFTTTLPVTTTSVEASAQTTIATVTSPTTVCNNGVTPTTTATVYTGTYSPIPGQNTTLPNSYPTLASCTEYETAFVSVWATVQGTGTTTSTVTKSTAGTDTITSSVTYTRQTTIYQTTSRVTINAYEVAASTATVTTDCVAAPTATYAAQCAPQNLIGTMDGAGLNIGTFNVNFTFGGWAGMAKGDASLCCQLCVENAGCAASVYWAQSDSCLLGYVGGPDDCPVAFTYGADAYDLPGEGNIFQVGAGCATIEYDGPGVGF